MIYVCLIKFFDFVCVICINCGFIVKLCVVFFVVFVIVVEKNINWWLCIVDLIIFCIVFIIFCFIIWLNLLNIIVFILCIFSFFIWINFKIWFGELIIIFGCFFNFLIWCLIFVLLIKDVFEILVFVVNFWIFLWICIISLCVGVKIIICGCFILGLILCKRGNKYVNVFFVLVGDLVIMFCFFKIVGIVCFWILVNFLKLVFF